MQTKGRKNKKYRLPQIKKDIKDFILNEEGKICQKDIAKMGISLAVLGMMLQPQDAQAGHASHSNHSNSFFVTGKGGHSSGPLHSSGHANHSEGGPCGW